MEYNNYLGWIYPKTQNLVNAQDVENIIYLQKGNSGGLATLDGSGKVPASQLPSYVDDVLEFETKYDFPNRGEEGKIYVDTDSNYTYRWTGNTYILIGGLQNLVDGTVTGSIRSVTAVPENGNYHLGNDAIALGTSTKSSGIASNAEGFYTEASGNGSHVEGYAIQDNVGGYGEIKASGIGSHAQGYSYAYHSSNSAIIASGNGAHAQGYAYDANTVASGNGAHAEGYITQATGNYSHAENRGVIASGQASHAEGQYTNASGQASHAGGIHTTAQRKSQTVIGEYNILDTSGTTTTRGDYAFIIGNGTSSTRSNALTVKWDGVVESSGTPTANNHLTTKQYVDNAINSSVTFFTATMVNDTPTVTFTYNQVKNAIDANKLAFIKLQYTKSGEDYSGTFCNLIRITGYSTTTLEGVSLYRVFTDKEMEFNAATATAVMTYYQASSGQTDPNPADRDPNDFQ